MKSNYLISILLVPLLVTGCAAVRPVTDMAAGAGGGVIANQLSHGDPGITAAGAAGGVGVGVGVGAVAAGAVDIVGAGVGGVGVGVGGTGVEAAGASTAPPTPGTSSSHPG